MDLFLSSVLSHRAISRNPYICFLTLSIVSPPFFVCGVVDRGSWARGAVVVDHGRSCGSWAVGADGHDGRMVGQEGDIVLIVADLVWQSLCG